MNTIPNQLIDDLKIYSQIFSKINHTTTSFGECVLKKFLKTNMYDVKNLELRKQILKSLLADKKRKDMIQDNLTNIKSLESDYNWLYSKKQKEAEMFIEDFYYGYDLFNNEFLLDIKNNKQKYTIATFFIIIIVVYVLSTYYKKPINVSKYAQIIYKRYNNLAKFFVNFITKNKKYIKYLTSGIIIYFIISQLQSFRSIIMKAHTHHNHNNNFKSRFQKISVMLNHVNSICKVDDFYKNKEFIDSIQFLTNIFNKNKLNNIGYCLVLYKKLHLYKDHFINVEKYIGEIDTYLSIVRLYLSDDYCFPIYSDKQKPLYKSTDLWHPSVPKDERVTNDIELGLNNIIILTGPNASGKSTYLESCMLVVYLGQTLGISPCKTAIFTPFSILNTHINFSYTIGYESSFEAKMNKCYDCYKTIKDVRKLCFTIVDELFIGTNPEEGITSSYSMCEHFEKCKNNLLIVSTHYHKLTKLQNRFPECIKNKATYVIRKDGKLYTPFKIIDGVSKQNIAIELLTRKGYDDSITNTASNILESMKKKTKINKINIKLKELSPDKAQITN